MLRGLTRAGVGSIGADEAYIRKAAKYGFQSVDLNPLDLIRVHGQEGAIQLLESNGVIIGSFDLHVEWRSSEEQFVEGLPSLMEAAAAAASLRCYTCCTYILPATDEPAASFIIAATRRLRIVSEILGAYGISLGLEFVGSHHLRTQWSNPTIWSMKDTLSWIEAIGSQNVGLLLDSYHWHTNGLTTEDLLQLKPQQIVHAHINDAKDLPIEQLIDNDRLYPGEGVIDLAGFISSLQSIGYRGIVAQEVISSSIEQSSDVLLARSQAGFDKVFGAGGVI
ncbi:sugar phosphate isomerase/epimerase family protein [Paenibacillus sp. LHD-117]|uniref:sugar phosphate isomerase/epimerase family protein n=1 Tax=Paenibacillus sp. LHD-117 TaxID=3071412 RepID=UPI0027E103D5|nr:sugar phosphate isomerase/epimerase family protein [Paenibacillus sp. LHD-117]MDQ6419591.1 sugar phosphate isomerase/epimerase family protein [Paenibacillus sp. LHD-117]